MGVKPRAGTKRSLQELIEAIKVLKDLEQTGRPASLEDKQVMARFTGFGAVATKAFPDPATGEYAAGYEDLGQELRELLTDEEYASAKATTYTAFYTSPVVMTEMFRALEKMGIGAGSRGLEPGCGIGGFVGAAPFGMEFVGIERDSLSGRIAKQLHPEHEIRVEPFQDSDLPDGSVDFAVGNVPFAEIKLRHRGERHSLHDYFFLRSLDAVRPGGAIAFVTSRYTMDKASPKVRELLAKGADFVGAIRLPGSAFADQGTSVVTDVIFLRKKPMNIDEEVGPEVVPEWMDKRWLTASTAKLDGGEITLNDYFAANPHMVIGQMSVGQGMYNGQALRVRSDGELAAALHAAVDGLPDNVCTERVAPLAATAFLELDENLPSHVTEGSFYMAPDRTIMQVVGGKAEPVMIRDKAMRADGTPGGKRLGLLIELRDRARHVLATQQDGRSAAERDMARQRLRQTYAGFRSQFGPINKTTVSERKDGGGATRRMPNVVRFRTDPDVYLVMALEHYDERANTAKPAAIMERDVVTAAEPIGKVDNAKDGLLACLNSLGCVDISHIASLYGRSEDIVVEELGQLVFFDPVLDAYVPADEYLSGNVRDKLRFAQLTEDPRVEGNVEALKAAQPEDLVAGEIDVSLGTPWIPARDVKKFLVETLGVSPAEISVEYVQKEALWKLRLSGGDRRSAAAISEFGTKDIDAYTLVEQALNMRTPTVRRAVSGGPGERDTYVVDQQATLAVREKQIALKGRFSRWVFEDPVRSERLVKFYNENFNNLKLRQFDGDHLKFPRMSSAIELRPHQKAAVWRNMSSGNTLLAHVVGAGKTFTMCAAAMEMRRTGLAKKPVIVIPNHMLEQFSREFLLLYPDANLLVATKQDLGKKRRQLLKARMATGDWDGIIMTHSSFEKIAMSPEFQARFLADEIREYEELIEGTLDRSLTGNLTKRLEKLKDARANKIKEMTEGNAKDGGLYFDELGIDYVFVDEAHMFKNLETATKMDRIAGVQTGGSNRAYDLLMKSRYLQSRTPGRGLTFATGTPVSNSLGEMYTMMRYLMPDLLRERGIEHFDAWAAAFGEVINSLEISPDGQSLRVNSRFAKFKNLPELLSLFRLSADVQTGAMLNLPVPALKGGKAEIVAAPMNDFQKDIQEGLVERYERVRSIKIDPRVDNVLKIITDGRKLALDARLVDRAAVDDPQSKVNQLVDRVYAIWERTKADRSTQLIFSDLGVSETVWGYCVYNDVMEKLEARGIPREEIASIGDANTDIKKESLFATVRSGRVRVLLGSTSKMGTGTNVQAKLVALHHLDPPWRPADIEQREGRILRQGNGNAEVEIVRYVTEGSFDSFMWQTLQTKAAFISQAMAGDAGTRRADDIGATELSFAEVKAIASGNPSMLVLAEMDMDVRKLKLLRNEHARDQADITREVNALPHYIASSSERITRLEQDVARRQDTKGDAFVMRVGNHEIRKQKGEKKTARQRADDLLSLAVAKASVSGFRDHKVGEIGGLNIILKAESKVVMGGKWSIVLEGEGDHHVLRITNPKSCTQLVHYLEQELRSFDGRLAKLRGQRDKWQSDLERYSTRIGSPFPSEDAYQRLEPLRDRLQALLSQQEAEEKLTEADRVPAEDTEPKITLPEYLQTVEGGDEVELSADGETGVDVQVKAEAPIPTPAVVELSAEDEILQIVEQYRGLSIHAEEPPQRTKVETPVAAPTEPEVTVIGDQAVSEDGDRIPVEALQLVEDDAIAVLSVEPGEVVEVETEAKALETDPDDHGQAADVGITQLVAGSIGETEKSIATEPSDGAQLVDVEAIVTGQPTPAPKSLAFIHELDDDGISWFQIAEKTPHDTWQILSLYPQITHRELHPWEQRRKGNGVRDEVWVREHLTPADMIEDLGQYLTDDELQRLIPEQRLAQQEEVVEPEVEPVAVKTPTPKVPVVTPAPTAPVVTSPRRTGRAQSTPTTGKGQMGLLFDTEEKTEAAPATKPLEPSSQPISRQPVQMGLFGAAPLEKPAKEEPEPTDLLARSYQAAAWDVRVSEGEAEWTLEDEAFHAEMEAAEMEARSRLDESDPFYVAPPEILFDDLDEQEQRQVKAITAEFDLLWEGASWAQAIGSYEGNSMTRVSRRLYDYLTIEDRKLEAGQWKESLSAGEELDLMDRLDDGGSIGEPEPSERAVLGRFTGLIGDQPQVGDIVHDAIERHESYGSMVERIVRETGRGKRAADDRGIRSLYNATVARRSGWDAAR